MVDSSDGSPESPAPIASIGKKCSRDSASANRTLVHTILKRFVMKSLADDFFKGVDRNIIRALLQLVISPNNITNYSAYGAHVFTYISALWNSEVPRAAYDSDSAVKMRSLPKGLKAFTGEAYHHHRIYPGISMRPLTQLYVLNETELNVFQQLNSGIRLTDPSETQLHELVARIDAANKSTGGAVANRKKYINLGNNNTNNTPSTTTNHIPTSYSTADHLCVTRSTPNAPPATVDDGYELTKGGVAYFDMVFDSAMFTNFFERPIFQALIGGDALFQCHMKGLPEGEKHWLRVARSRDFGWAEPCVDYFPNKLRIRWFQEQVSQWTLNDLKASFVREYSQDFIKHPPADPLPADPSDFPQPISPARPSADSVGSLLAHLLSGSAVVSAPAVAVQGASSSSSQSSSSSVSSCSSSSSSLTRPLPRPAQFAGSYNNASVTPSSPPRPNPLASDPINFRIQLDVPQQKALNNNNNNKRPLAAKASVQEHPEDEGNDEEKEKEKDKSKRKIKKARKDRAEEDYAEEVEEPEEVERDSRSGGKHRRTAQKEQRSK